MQLLAQLRGALPADSSAFEGEPADLLEAITYIEAASGAHLVAKLSPQMTRGVGITKCSSVSYRSLLSALQHLFRAKANL